MHATTEPTLPAFPGYHAGQCMPLMRPEGRGTSGIMLLGEALGEHESKDQLPFRPYAEAGSVLERALWRAGISRDSLTLSNLVWYQPPRNWLEGAPWEMDAIHACRHLNDELVQRTKPKVILALGGLAFRELTGMSGEKQGIQMCRGFICENIWWSGIPVVGTYHPSFLRRGSKERQKDTPESKVVAAGGGTQGMALLGVLIRDLQLCESVARQGTLKFAYDNYKLGAILDDWRDALGTLQMHPELPIAYDFETKDSLRRDSEEDIERTVTEVTQAQISWRSGQALVSPWTPDLLPILRDILALPNPKLDWNGRKFDRPIARDMGIMLNGELHDLMDLWHHAQPDLSRGLQFATSFFVPEVGPWKHISGTDPLYYGALDVDMPQRIYAALRTSLTLVQEPHSGISLWSGYQDQIVRLSPVLDRMTARGIPVDEDKRHALDVQFTKSLDELDHKMQTLYPDELRNIHPKEGYKRDPAPLRDYQKNLFQDAIELPPQVQLEEATYVRRIFQENGRGTERWAELLPFTANSPDQVLRYVTWKTVQEQEDLIRKWNKSHTDDLPDWVEDGSFARRDAWVISRMKWEVPMDYKTSKPTTAESGLRRLAERTGDQLLLWVLDYREISKARGTYVEGWKPGLDGRVHPSFGYKPATPQLSSEGPNAQNFPVHADIAHVMRQMICTKPTHRMLKFDWKSFHVLTLGFEAQDPRYCRMARNDMHSFFALCGMLRIEAPEKVEELPDEELQAKLAWYRASDKTYQQFGWMTFEQIRNEKAKRAILGIGFGQQARSLYMLNRESYSSIAEAQQCLDMLNILFPKPEVWRRQVCLEADRQSYLLTRFGHVRRFFDVFHRKPVASNYQPNRSETLVQDKSGKRWILKPGDDHEAVIAYRPATDAFGIKRQVMVELGEDELDERFGLIVEIHDDLRFECPTNLVEECVKTVKSRMEAPCPILKDPIVAPDGLWCGVEVSLGQNWDDKSGSNPEGMEKLKI